MMLAARIIKSTLKVSFSTKRTIMSIVTKTTFFLKSIKNQHYDFSKVQIYHPE